MGLRRAMRGKSILVGTVVCALVAMPIPALGAPTPTPVPLTENPLQDPLGENLSDPAQPLWDNSETATTPAVIANVNTNDSTIRRGATRKVQVQFVKEKKNTSGIETRRYEVTLHASIAGITVTDAGGSDWTCKTHGKAQKCTTSADKVFSDAPSVINASFTLSPQAQIGSADLRASLAYEQRAKPNQKSDDPALAQHWNTITDPAPDLATSSITVADTFGLDLSSGVGTDYVAPVDSDGQISFTAHLTNAGNQGVELNWKQTQGPALKPDGALRAPRVTKQSTLNVIVPRKADLAKPKTVTFQVTASDDGVEKQKSVSVLLVRERAAVQLDKEVGQKSKQQNEPLADNPVPQQKPAQLDPVQQQQNQEKQDAAQLADKLAEARGLSEQKQAEHREDAVNKVEQAQQGQQDQADAMKSVLGNAVDGNVLDQIAGVPNDDQQAPAVSDQNVVTSTLQFTPASADAGQNVTAKFALSALPQGWASAALTSVQWSFQDADDPNAVPVIVSQETNDPRWSNAPLDQQYAQAVFTANGHRIVVTVTAAAKDWVNQDSDAKGVALATAVFTPQVEAKPESDAEQGPWAGVIGSAAAKAVCEIANKMSTSKDGSDPIVLPDGSVLTLAKSYVSPSSKVCSVVTDANKDKAEAEAEGKDPADIPEGGHARLSAKQPKVSFEEGKLKFAGINFKQVKGVLDLKTQKITISSLALDPAANQSSWAGKIVSKVSQINTKELGLEFAADGKPGNLKGSGELNLSGALGVAATGVNALLDVIGVKGMDIPLLNRGEINDLNPLQFSFNTTPDPLATPKSSKAILGASFVVGKPEKAAAGVQGAALVNAYFRDTGEKPRFIAGELQIHNAGPIALGQSTGLISGTLRTDLDAPTKASQKEASAAVDKAQAKIDELTPLANVSAAASSQLLEAKNQKEQAEQKLNATEVRSWSGSLQLTCAPSKSTQVVPDTSTDGEPNADGTPKTKKVVKNGYPVCAISDFVAIKDAKIAYVGKRPKADKAEPKDEKERAARERADEAIDMSSGLTLTATVMMWKRDEFQIPQTVGCSAAAYVEDAPSTAKAAQEVGCREITLSAKGFISLENQQLQLQIAAKGSSRDVAKEDPAAEKARKEKAEKDKAAGKTAVEQDVIVKDKDRKAQDSVIDLGWGGLSLTEVHGVVGVKWGDQVKDLPWWKKVQLQVGGTVKGAFSDFGTATAEIGNLCEEADAEAGRCRVGSMYVSFKVNVPFAPITKSGDDQAAASVASAVGSAQGSDSAKKKESTPSKQVTAEGLADWGSSRLTLKGSYGDGSANLGSGFGLRNLGITVTNDPAEKPTVCVTDAEAKERLAQRGVNDAKAIKEAKDKAATGAKKDLENAEAALTKLKNSKTFLDEKAAKLDKEIADLAAVARVSTEAAQNVAKKRQELAKVQQDKAGVVIDLQLAQDQVDQAKAKLATAKEQATNAAKDSEAEASKAKALADEKAELAKENSFWIGISGTALISGLQLDVQGRYAVRDRELCMAVQGTRQLSFDAESGNWNTHATDASQGLDSGSSNFGVSNWGIVYTNYPAKIQRPELPSDDDTTPAPITTLDKAPGINRYETVSLDPGLTLMGRVPVGQIMPDALASKFDKKQFIDVSAFVGTTEKFGRALRVKAKFKLVKASYLIGSQEVNRKQTTLAFTGFDGSVTIGTSGVDVSFTANSELTSPTLDAQGKADPNQAPVARDLSVGISATAIWGGAANKGISVSLFAALQKLKSDDAAQNVSVRADFGIQDFWIDHGSLAATVGSSSPVVVVDMQGVHLPTSWTKNLELTDSTVSATLVVASTGGGFTFATQPLKNVPIDKRGDQFNLAGKNWVKASEIGIGLITAPYKLPDPKDSTKMVDYRAGFTIVFNGEIFGAPVRLNASVGLGAGGLKLCTDIKIPRLSIMGGLVLSGYDNKYGDGSTAGGAQSSTWSCDGKDPGPLPTAGVSSALPAAVASPAAGQQSTSKPVIIRLDLDSSVGRYKGEMDASIKAGIPGMAVIDAGVKGNFSVGANDAKGKPLGTTINMIGGGTLNVGGYDMAKAKFAVNLNEKSGGLTGNVRFSATADILVASVGVSGALGFSNGDISSVGVRGKVKLLWWTGVANLAFCPEKMSAIEYSSDPDTAPRPVCRDQQQGESGGPAIEAWFGYKSSSYPELATPEPKTTKQTVPVADGPDVLKYDWSDADRYMNKENWDPNKPNMYMTTGTLDKVEKSETCGWGWGMPPWNKCETETEYLPYRMSLATSPLYKQGRPSWMWGRDYERLTDQEEELAAGLPPVVDGTADPQALSADPLPKENPCVAIPSVTLDESNTPVGRSLAVVPRGAVTKSWNQSCSALVYLSVKNIGYENIGTKLEDRGWGKIRPGLLTCYSSNYAPGVLRLSGLTGSNCTVKYFDYATWSYKSAPVKSGVDKITTADMGKVKQLDTVLVPAKN